MSKSHWRARRADDLEGAIVFVHPDRPDVRIEPGLVVVDGVEFAHGVQITIRDGDDWLPVDGGGFFWVHEAQAWAESELMA